MNTSQSFHTNSSSGKEKWNMEFKDATSAAQAAAESAERASIAARAAAQLSSQGKITRQYSTESYNSEQRSQVSSEHTGHHSFKDSYNNISVNDRKPKIQNQQTGPTEIDASPKPTKKSNSLRSRNDSIKENFGQRSSVDSEKLLRKTTKYDGAHSDDETDSDDSSRFDTEFEYDEGEAKSFFPSPDRESFRLPEKTRISVPSPKTNTSNITGRVDSSKSVDHSVKFDLSDGPDSETETEMTKSSLSGSKKSTSRVDPPRYVESPPKVNPTKSRIELNDLVEVPGSGSSSHNEYDDFDTGNDLKFGTLTGGLRNKGGLKYPPYTKTTVKEKVDPTPKQSSFNSRASRPDNKKPSVSKSSSESDSDDHNEPFPVHKSFKTRSQFAPPDKFFSNDETNSEEEVSPVPKRMSTGPGPGLSRRTKGQVEPVGKTVISHPDTNHEPLETSSTSAEQKSNTRSNITKTPPEPRPDPARFRQETSQTKPGPTKKIVESGKTESPKAMNLSSETKLEASNVKKPSHVHPKLPDYDSLAARIHALNKMNHQ